ncbi:MAG: agmatine deiminase family protein [Muribaculaceae bacterium]|nr:agmatine deiminase family protein [Muribaculaceae bacterium]
MKDIRMIAEWESCECVLLALPAPHTDWNYILEEACAQYRRLIGAFTEAGVKCVVLSPSREYAEKTLGNLIDSDDVTVIAEEYNDTWTRDYGPISVERGERLIALDFGFNGWGLKFASDKDNLVNLRLKEKSVMLPAAYRNERSFILEGGSIESDGRGTILTTSRCLQSPNRNGGMNKQELNKELEERLGADHVLWLDYGELAGDDTDSHIDTLCRIAPGNVILFTGCRNMDDDHFEPLLKMRAQLTMFRNPEGEPYNLVELPLPDPIYDEAGQRLPATYANYLVTPTHIFMPTYGQPMNDDLACTTVRVAFPDHEVVGVDCLTLIRQHGSLHCATMQIPAGIFNPVVTEND